jgi:AraC family transcriptional regulator
VTNRLVYFRPMRLVHIRAMGPYEQSRAAAWKRMFEWLSNRGHHKMPGCGYGLLLDDPRAMPVDECRYDACVDLSTVGEQGLDMGVMIRRLPIGAFARTRHVGPYSNMNETIRNLRDTWLPQNGLLVDQRRPFVEVYLDDPRNGVAEKRRSECCIPVIPDVSENNAVA